MRTSIIVQNLKCGGCAKTISTKLSEIDDITEIDIDVDKSKITFRYINQSELDAVNSKLKTLGYPPVGDENSVISKAKSFVSCATGKLKE